MKHYSIKPSKISNSILQDNHGTSGCYVIIEKEVIGEYDLCLLFLPSKVFDNCDGLYQIGLQLHGIDYDFQEEKLLKMNKINVAHMPVHTFGKTIRQWIEKYRYIVFSSKNSEYMKSYRRILKWLGFTVEPIKIRSQLFYILG